MPLSVKGLHFFGMYFADNLSMKRWLKCGFVILVFCSLQSFAQDAYLEVARQSVLRANYTALSNAGEPHEGQESAIDWEYFEKHPDYSGLWGLISVYVYKNKEFNFYDAEHIKTDLNIAELLTKSSEKADDRRNLEIRLGGTFLQTISRRRINVLHQNGFPLAHTMTLGKSRDVFKVISSDLGLSVADNISVMCALSIHNTMVCMHEEFLEEQVLPEKIVLFIYKEESF